MRKWLVFSVLTLAVLAVATLVWYVDGWGTAVFVCFVGGFGLLLFAMDDGSPLITIRTHTTITRSRDDV